MDFIPHIYGPQGKTIGVYSASVYNCTYNTYVQIIDW